MSTSIVPHEPQSGKDLAVFDFNGYIVRVDTDEFGEPHFIAADVCTALDLGNTSRALARLDAEEKGVTTSNTPGGPQQMTTVTESGLYSLIFNSRKPEAKAFKKWVSSEVLPAIRKYGSYIQKPMTALEIVAMHAQALVEQERRMAQIDARLEHVEDTLDAAEGAPQMMTVAAYAKWKGLALADGEISGIGRKATTYSNAHGLPIKKMAHKVYGTVNVYHIDVLKLMFSQRTIFEGK